MSRKESFDPLPKRADPVRVLAESRQVGVYDAVPMPDVPRDEVGHQAIIQVALDPLDRVVVRRVGQLPLQVQPGEAPAQRADRRL